ncbi:MAG: hypothetical protein ACKOCD_01100 [Nitrospiraceae bacterium]
MPTDCARGVLLGLCLVSMNGCAEGAKFAQLDEQGGIVVYPLKKERESIYASPSRAEAIKMIEAHCHGAYLITKDGETTSQTRNTGRDGDDLLTVRRYWGMQFKCK